MSIPKVSIIIVNYNGKAYIEKCLSSIFASNYPISDYEIILVDNKSTDGSIELVEGKFRDLKIVRLNKNLGYVGGVNIGEKIAKGNYLIVLNNDISVTENWLSELVKSIESDETIEICTSKTLLMDNPLVIDGAGSTNNIIGQGWSAGMGQIDKGQHDTQKEVSHPSGCSFITRKRAIEKYGYFLDPDFFMWQDDLDIGWRVRLLGFKVLYTPTSVAFHKCGGSSSASPFTYYLFYRNMLITFYQNLSDNYLKKVLPLVETNICVSHFFAFIRGRDPGYLINIFRILSHFRKNKIKFMKKRAEIQKIRNCSDNQIFSIFSPLIIVPESVEKYDFMPKLFLKLINSYLEMANIPVTRFSGLYYY